MSGLSTNDLDWRAFDTARLRLVPFAPTDTVRAFSLKAFNTLELVQQLNVVPYPYSDQDFDTFAQWMAEQTDFFQWSIALRDDPETVIGQICLRPDQDGQRSLAYFTLPETWGQGVATEALNAVVEFGFDVLEAESLFAEVYNDNPGSLAVIQKVGFAKTGSGESASGGRAPGKLYPHSEFTLDAKGFRNHRMRDGCHSYTSIVHRQLPIITVAAAALVNMQGEILVAQRPAGKSMAGLWEFPGGKLEVGETPEAALIRELHEELGIRTDHSCLSPVAFASHSYAKFHLMMPVFAIRQWQGDITGREGQAFKWVKPRELWNLDMPPADEPIIPLLCDLL